MFIGTKCFIVIDQAHPPSMILSFGLNKVKWTEVFKEKEKTALKILPLYLYCLIKINLA